MEAEKFFVDTANCMLKESVHPVFWQYHVICCAFYSVCLEICWRGEGNLFFFQRGQKEGREKLFCSLWFCGGCSGLQMYFFLWCWNSFLIIDAGLRISIYGCSISKCGCAKTNLGQNISKCGCKNTKIGWQFSNLGCENTIADAIFLNADVRILKQDKKLLNVDANFLFE